MDDACAHLFSVHSVALFLSVVLCLLACGGESFLGVESLSDPTQLGPPVIGRVSADPIRGQRKKGVLAVLLHSIDCYIIT